MSSAFTVSALSPISGCLAPLRVYEHPVYVPDLPGFGERENSRAQKLLGRLEIIEDGVAFHSSSGRSHSTKWFRTLGLKEKSDYE
jgi:hypothetical protein